VCYSVQQDGTIVKHLFNLQISLVQPVTQCRSQPFLLVKGPNELIKNVGMSMARDSSGAIVELVDRTVNTAVVAQRAAGSPSTSRDCKKNLLGLSPTASTIPFKVEGLVFP
jgi:hypothetical protein